MAEPTVCTLCRQPRRLILMASGARWWCDQDPHPDGHVIITELLPDGRVRGRVLAGPELPAPDDVEAFRPHDHTCVFSQEAARLRWIKQPKCGICRTPLHPLLVQDDITTHPLCLPVTPGEELAAARAQLRERRAG